MRLVTLNTWALPWRFSFDPVRRMESIAPALAALRPDVVLLQELWNRTASTRLLDKLSRSGLGHQWTDGVGLGNGGLAIASRLPFRDARFRRFVVQGRPEKLRHGDYYGGKGFVAATLETARGPVTVLNTHLHSRHVSSTPHLYLAERTAQAVQLASLLRFTPSPCVVAGDFNMSPQDEVYGVFATLAGCSDAGLAQDPPLPTHLHLESGRRERLDYFFVKSTRVQGLAVRRLDVALTEDLDVAAPIQRFSDHAAVLIDVEPASQPPPAQPSDGALAAAIGTARRILDDARRAQQARQLGQRIGAAAGASIAVGGIVAQHRWRRRAFLRASALATAGVGALGGAACFSLAEHSSRRDLQGYGHALELLGSIAASL